MPAALDVDREQVKMLVLEVGCHEAARRLGLAEGTVRQWDNRFGWTASIPRDKPLPPSRVQPVTLVTSPSDALASAMREDAMGGRAAALRATRKSLVHMAELPAEELCDKDVAQTLHVHVKSAAIAGGYGASDRADLTGKAFGKRNEVIETDPSCVTILQELDTQEFSTAETGQIGSDDQT